MKVKVIVNNFGTYKAGDEIEMHESTANAVVKAGKVEIIDGSDDEPKKKKEVKK